MGGQAASALGGGGSSKAVIGAAEPTRLHAMALRATAVVITIAELSFEVASIVETCDAHHLPSPLVSANGTSGHRSYYF